MKTPEDLGRALANLAASYFDAADDYEFIEYFTMDIAAAITAERARADKLAAALRECMVQAIGCWTNHYAGDDPAQSAEPTHIATARTALAEYEG